MKLFLLLATCAVAATAYPGTPQRPRPWWNSLEATEGRIVGGFEVDIKDVPYQVSLRSFGSHICGGSIISKRWILTAAHCASSADRPKETIRVGSSEKGSGGQILKLKRIVQHPQYDGSIIDYDFSLLELAEELELDDSHTTIALPEQDEPVTDGAICRVSGWGNTQSSAQSNKFLRATDVPSVNQDKCSEAYSDFGGVTPRMICAGYQEGGKDACQGDSGGPLVSGGKLVGVVSWGYGCAVAGYPDVYSQIASVRDWIKEVSDV
uniref:trypsin n=1 Tax=Culex quinquefasciatus TaxID=7176 RepID=O02569_CULQU|nr:early trypsin precursor [Culex quinquefasciatus]AAK50138.1 early trypsin [Culex quinquefasciatus]